MKNIEILNCTFDSDAGIVLAINKPINWTSFEVIKKLRHLYSVKKIGHAGTLDPLATGILLVCIGKKTKLISNYQSMLKVYEGEMVIGKTTPSIDLETSFDSEKSWNHIDNNQIFATVNKFVGHIKQIPPIYSAVKINGERAYKIARRGDLHVIPSEKIVFVESFEIIGVEIPSIQFRITCGKGTYIRSIVRDFGQILGVGAHLKQLCRTQIGPFLLKDAISL